MGKHEGLNVALLVKKCYNRLIETKDSSFRSIQTKYLLPSKSSLLWALLPASGCSQVSLEVLSENFDTKRISNYLLCLKRIPGPIAFVFIVIMTTRPKI